MRAALEHAPARRSRSSRPAGRAAASTAGACGSSCTRAREREFVGHADFHGAWLDYSLVITSAHNPKLKLIRRLLESRRQREKEGLFVCEGEDLVDAARDAGIEPVELLVAGEDVEPALVAELSTLAPSAARDRRSTAAPTCRTAPGR